jgi:hypothetical protein
MVEIKQDGSVLGEDPTPSNIFPLILENKLVTDIFVLRCGK